MTTIYPDFGSFFKEFDRIAADQGKPNTKELYEALSNFCYEKRGIEIDTDMVDPDRSSKKNYESYLKLKEKEGFGECLEGFENLYDDIIGRITAFDEGEPVWREVFVEDDSTIKMKEDVGIFWTWKEEGAVGYCAFVGNIRVVYEAVRSQCDDPVDWFSTILVNLMTMMDEAEIRMKKGGMLVIEKIMVKKEGLPWYNIVKEPFDARA